MNGTIKLGALLLALSALSACDFLEERQFEKERANRTYRTAMDDYGAGRLPQAIEGLKKVCRVDPANASARFQLACLLQDSEKDFFGAACAYREYLQQQGGSDKAKMASDRLATCELELAKVLASKYRLNDVAEQVKRNGELQEELAIAAKRQEKLQKDLAVAMQRVSQLVQETDRLKNLLKNGDEEPTARVTDVTEALALLQEEDGETKTRATDVSGVQAVLKDGADESSRPSVDSDTSAVTALLDEEARSTDLLTQAPGAKAKRDAAKQAAEDAARKKSAEAAAAKAKRPDSYVVQDGDTLYKLAVRFYGHAGAWSRIREANKAIISTDGRIRTGQRLVLPE